MTRWHFLQGFHWFLLLCLLVGAAIWVGGLK